MGEFMSRSRPIPSLAALGLLVVAVVAFAGGLAAQRFGSQTSSISPRLYEVALGDSISYGDYASSPLASFVGRLYLHERSLHPSLELVNLACGGETSQGMINGSLSSACDYFAPGNSQLHHALTFLRQHRGRVSFITIDLGIDDVVAGQGSDVSSNLVTILRDLYAADPHVRIVGMNYYDFDGLQPTWDTAAATSALNMTLANVYGMERVPMVNAYRVFGSNHNTLCRLTFECSTTMQNLHPTDAGYARLASAFERVIDG
jgi:lysophospholipase L1-like esterase